MSTVLVSPEDMTAYRAAARRRQKRDDQELARLQEHAWAAARCAARLLKEQFGATRVVVFGSLVHEGCFTRWSDVDLAAWGIRLDDTFRAIGAVMDVGAEVEVNLVDVKTCRPSLLAAIEQGGVEL